MTKQEIRDHLGQNARILTHHYGEAIHIIMERANGKTGEVYVEFFSQADAQACVNDWGHVRRSKVRDRFVHMQMSSQEALMERLFPKARNVTWNGQIPIVAPPQPPFTGFRSFIDHEELLQLEKLVDISVRRVSYLHYSQQSRCESLTLKQQDSYSSKSPERAYENIISVLYKVCRPRPSLHAFVDVMYGSSACLAEIYFSSLGSLLITIPLPTAIGYTGRCSSLRRSWSKRLIPWVVSIKLYILVNRSLLVLLVLRRTYSAIWSMLDSTRLGYLTDASPIFSRQ